MVQGYSEELKEYLDVENARTSKHPDKLEAQLRTVDFDGNVEFLDEIRHEAHRTVDKQIATINDVDTKASKLLRLNLLILGLIVSALSIGTQLFGELSSGAEGSQQSNLALSPLLNDLVIAGIGVMMLSIVLAAWTYSTTNLDVGVGRDNLITLLSADFNRVERRELVVKNYVARINRNRSAGLRILPLISATIVLTISSIALFALGIHRIVFDGVPVYLWAGFVVIVTSSILMTGLTKQTLRAIADIRTWKKSINE